MHDHDGEFVQGLKMAATAVVSAVLVAGLVITAGGAVLDRRARAEIQQPAAQAPAAFIRTGG